MPFCLSLHVQLFTQQYFSRDDACVFDCMRSERVKTRNEKLKVKQKRHACMQHCVHGRKNAFGLRNEFFSPRFSLFVIFLFLLRWLCLSLFAFKSTSFIFIENLVIHETIAGQERQQFYYVVKLHMDAFKWLDSIVVHISCSCNTEKKSNFIACFFCCNDGSFWLIGWT